MHIMDPFKSMIDTTRRRVSPHKTWRTVHSAGIHIRKNEGAHARREAHIHTRMHTFPLFFHEINKFPVHKTQHGGDVHVIGYARRQHGVVINSKRAEDIFSTPTSLVLTFCRNTVEVKDVRKGEKKKHRGGEGI